MRKTKMVMTLPKVGDRLSRCITKCKYDDVFSDGPFPCKVVYVNEDHHWYKVKFDEFDLEECFGLPVFDHSIFRGIGLGQACPIVCIETGDVYPTVDACAKDMFIDSNNLSTYLNDNRETICGYHFAPIF